MNDEFALENQINLLRVESQRIAFFNPRTHSWDKQNQILGKPIYRFCDLGALNR